jgi:hypothetical protein
MYGQNGLAVVLRQQVTENWYLTDQFICLKKPTGSGMSSN